MILDTIINNQRSVVCGELTLFPQSIILPGTMFASSAIVALVLLFLSPAHAEGTTRNLVGDYSEGSVTIAAFGDWPYSQDLLDNSFKLINSVNADPKVKYVVHVGDIHSGSMPCTGSGMSGTATLVSKSSSLTGLALPVGT